MLLDGVAAAFVKSVLDKVTRARTHTKKVIYSGLSVMRCKHAMYRASWR